MSCPNCNCVACQGVRARKLSELAARTRAASERASAAAAHAEAVMRGKREKAIHAAAEAQRADAEAKTAETALRKGVAAAHPDHGGPGGDAFTAAKAALDHARGVTP